MREIKRYANRKLYDMEESRYITLDEIALLIKNGEDIKVIENKTGEDISRQTLAQIILKLEKRKRTQQLPITVFHEWIQKGGSTISDTLQRSVKPFKSLYGQLEIGVEKFLSGLVERGVVTEDEGRSIFRKLIERADKGRESLEVRIDERIAWTLSKLNIPTTDEVDVLKRKIDDLIKMIDELTEK